MTIKTLRLALCGLGNVGRNFLTIMQSQELLLRERHKLELRLVAGVWIADFQLGLGREGRQQKRFRPRLGKMPAHPHELRHVHRENRVTRGDPLGRYG